MLKNKETNNRIIYYGRDNNTIFNTAIRIENRRDINDLINDLKSIGIVEYYQNSRPNSKWAFEALIDVVIKIFKTVRLRQNYSPPVINFIQLNLIPRGVLNINSILSPTVSEYQLWRCLKRNSAM